MDILNRLGISNKDEKRSRFAEFYSLKKDIKSNTVAIENSIIANSINDLISYRVSPRGEDGDERKGLLKKTKDGVVNIINKIIAFFKRVKDYIMKKFRQFKEFVFGKKADKVEKATKAATTIINEVIKKDGVVPTDMPNNAWEYMKKQRSDANKAGQSVADAKDKMRNNINEIHKDLNNYIKKSFGDMFGDNTTSSKNKSTSVNKFDKNMNEINDLLGQLNSNSGSKVKTVMVESVGVPSLLVGNNEKFILEEKELNKLVDSINDYIAMLTIRDMIYTSDTDLEYVGVLEKYSSNTIGNFEKIIGLLTKYEAQLNTNADVTIIPYKDKKTLNIVKNNIDIILKHSVVITSILNRINDSLIKQYDKTISDLNKVKESHKNNDRILEIYNKVTNINSTITKENDKLLKLASNIYSKYASLLTNVFVAIHTN